MRTGEDVDIKPSPLKRTRTPLPLRASGRGVLDVDRLDTDNIVIGIDHDEAQVTNQSTN